MQLRVKQFMKQGIRFDICPALCYNIRIKYTHWKGMAFMLQSDALPSTAAALCLNCYQPPCDEACPYGCRPSEMLFALLQEDGALAAAQARAVSPEQVCACAAPCMQACLRAKLDMPVPIKKAHLQLCGGRKE